MHCSTVLASADTGFVKYQELTASAELVSIFIIRKKKKKEWWIYRVVFFCQSQGLLGWNLLLHPGPRNAATMEFLHDRLTGNDASWTFTRPSQFPNFPLESVEIT